jgi:hypothetical protein
MKKLIAIGILWLLALPIAGVFGMVHDQVSYTVSHEYFTKFKFQQFHLLDPSIPERIRVAEIGFLASWWMGIPIGFLIAPVTLIHRSVSAMFRLGLMSYLILIVVTALFSTVGLLYGIVQTRTIDLLAYHGWFIPPDLVDLRRFLCTGYMHNAAYLGGTIGIAVALLFHLLMCLKQKPGR